MNDEPLSPEDDFDPEELVVGAAGKPGDDPRVKWIKRHLHQNKDFYWMNGAELAHNQSSDFTIEANYHYMERTYSFLDSDGGTLGFNSYDKDMDEDMTLYMKVGGIEEEEWDQFTDDVDAASNYQDLDEDKVQELRNAAEEEWAQDYIKDLRKGLTEKFGSEVDSFVLFQISRLTESALHAWMQKYEEWPEDEQGSFYMRDEALIPHITTEDIDEQMPPTPVLRAAYEGEKDEVYRALYADKVVRWLETVVRGNERAEEILGGMNLDDIRTLFMRYLVPDSSNLDPERPYWAMSTLELVDGQERTLPGVFMGELAQRHNGSRNSESIQDVQWAVEEYGVEAIMRFGKKVPVNHPELPLGDSQAQVMVCRILEAEDDAEDFGPEEIAHGMGEDVIASTHDWVVVHLPNKDSVMQWFGAKGPTFNTALHTINNPWGIHDYFMVVPQANKNDRRFLAVYENGKIKYDRNTVEPELLKILLGYYAARYREEEDTVLLKIMMGIGGIKAVRRFMRNYQISSEPDLDVAYGLELLKGRRYQSAAKWLGAEAVDMTRQGYRLVVDDWQDFVDMFYHSSREDHRETAKKVFDYDTFDFFWDYSSPNNVDDLTVKEIDPRSWEMIREAMLGRTVQFEDEDEPTLLTRETLAEIPDDTLLELIEDSDQEELEEFRDALNKAIEDTERQSLEDELHKAATDGIIQALGANGFKFIDKPGKPGSDQLEIIVPWASVISIVDAAYQEDEVSDIRSALIDHNPEPVQFKDNLYDYGEAYSTVAREHPDWWQEHLHNALGEVESPGMPDPMAGEPELPLEGQPPVQEDMSKAQINKEAKKSDNADLSDEQKEAGNYEKGHVDLHGWDISVENGKGSQRTGTGKDGSTWSVTMPAHYGYIKGTVGKDKDHIDVYIGPSPQSERVFVVNQKKSEGGFDEHKVMLGFDTKSEAVKTYDKGFNDGLGPRLRGSVIITNVDTFKAWLDKGDPKKPFPPRFVGESRVDAAFFLPL